MHFFLLRASDSIAPTELTRTGWKTHMSEARENMHPGSEFSIFLPQGSVGGRHDHRGQLLLEHHPG